MKMIWVFLLTTLFAVTANALPQRMVRDLHLPTQVMLEHQTITAPILANTTYILSANAGNTSAAAATVTSFSHQPDVPRNLTVIPAGTTNDTAVCALVISGTDINSVAITETFNIENNSGATYTGSKAFKTVTSVAFPASCEDGGFAATWSVGVGSKLGMNHCMAVAGDYVWDKFNNAYAGTRGTAAASVANVEGNTFIPNGTMDGAKNVEIYYVQNFGCN